MKRVNDDCIKKHQDQHVTPKTTLACPSFLLLMLSSRGRDAKNLCTQSKHGGHLKNMPWERHPNVSMHCVAWRCSFGVSEMIFTPNFVRLLLEQNAIPFSACFLRQTRAAVTNRTHRLSRCQTTGRRHTIHRRQQRRKRGVRQAASLSPPQPPGISRTDHPPSGTPSTGTWSASDVASIPRPSTGWTGAGEDQSHGCRRNCWRLMSACPGTCPGNVHRGIIATQGVHDANRVGDRRCPCNNGINKLTSCSCGLEVEAFAFAEKLTEDPTDNRQIYV